jgi:hypothetical protein
VGILSCGMEEFGSTLDMVVWCHILVDSLERALCVLPGLGFWVGDGGRLDLL